MSNSWSREGDALWRGGGPEFEESFQEGACGWAEWANPNLPLLQVERWGTAQLLGHPWNNRAADDTGCGEKGAGTHKLNTFCGKRELSSLCSADFVLYKVSGSKAGTDSPWLAHRWAGRCWTWELPQRGTRASSGLCWAQGTAGAGLHGLTCGEPLWLTAVCRFERQQLLVPGGILLACFTSNLGRKNPY